MAGQAEKKLKKSASSGTVKYVSIGAIAFASYVAGSLFWGRFSYAWVAVFALSNAVNLYMILQALALGVAFDTWQDAFIITVLAEIFGSLFSSGELIFAIVPLYGLFLAVKAVGSYMDSTTARGEPVEMAPSKAVSKGYRTKKAQ